MAALISSVMDTKDRVPFFVSQAEQMGISILPPDVNLSDHEFVVVDRDIRFGLDAVKGVGFQAVEAIKDARNEGGPFRDLWDFCARVDGRCVNKKAIEALIKCGAFGSTGATRKGMLQVLEAAQAAGSKTQQDALIGQGSIFDLGMDLGGGAQAPARRARRAPRPGDHPRERGHARGRDGQRRGVAAQLRAPVCQPVEYQRVCARKARYHMQMPDRRRSPARHLHVDLSGSGQMAFNVTVIEAVFRLWCPSA